MESTTSRSPNNTPVSSGVTAESNFATPEINHGTPEINHGTPETNHGTPEINHGTPEINHGTPETNHGIQRSTEMPIGSTSTVTDTLVTEATVSTSTGSSPDVNVFGASKALNQANKIPLNGASIMELDKSPLDGQSSLKQELGVLTASDDCNGSDCDHEIGLNMGQLGDSEFDQDAHKYQVEEKTPDGYIIGEFGVISRSTDGFRGVRYIAHKSIDKQLIQDMLQTFLSL